MSGTASNINAGETVGIPALGGDFEQAVQVAIYGVETAVQRRVRLEVAPRVEGIFMNAGYKLASDDDVIAALAVVNLKSDFILPRYIGNGIVDPYLSAETVAHGQLRLMIARIVSQENPTLNFEQNDPTGAFLRAQTEEILKPLWNGVREKLSTTIKKEDGRSKPFRVPVKEPGSEGSGVMVTYRADKVEQLFPHPAALPTRAM